MCVLLLLFVAALTLSVGEPDLRADAAETDVGTRLVLILERAAVGADKLGHVFPRAATNDLLLHLVGVFFGRVIIQVGVEVARLAEPRLGVD